MADDVVLDAGSGGDTIAADDTGGKKYQIVKLTFGALDSQTIASSGNGTDDAGTQRVTLASDGTGQVKLAAGTAEVGKLAAGSATIGEVSIGTATTAATDLAKAIDVAAGASDVGVAPLAIRDDTLSGLTPAEGDWTPLRVGATGALHVTGGGGGTEYNEDDAAPSPIVGTASLMERDDVLSALTPVAGDWASFRCSAEGALWVQDFNSDTALTALQKIDDAVHVDDAAFTLGTHSGMMAMGFAGTQSVDANDAAALACETDGALHIHDGGNVITVDGTVTANPASGTIDTVTTVTAVTDITNTIDSTISGAALTALQVIDNPVFVDNAAFTLASSSVNVQGGVFQNGTPGTLADNDAGAVLLNSTAGQMVELMASTAAIGKLSANSGVDIGDVDATLAAETTKVIGTTITGAAATGGMSYDMLALAAEDNDKVIKGSAGTIYFISIQSIDATPVYLKLFDAASITPGTTNADLQFICPTNATASLGAGLVLNFSPGIQFGTGIVALVATGIALDDNTAVSANEVVVTLGFE